MFLQSDDYSILKGMFQTGRKARIIQLETCVKTDKSKINILFNNTISTFLLLVINGWTWLWENASVVYWQRFLFHQLHINEDLHH